MRCLHSLDVPIVFQNKNENLLMWTIEIFWSDSIPTFHYSFLLSSFIAGVRKFVLQMPGSNYFRLCRLYFLPYTTTQLCCYSMSAALSNALKIRIWLCSNKTPFMGTKMRISYDFHMSQSIVVHIKYFLTIQKYKNRGTMGLPK